MATEDNSPKVLIFDDFYDSIYRDYAQEGAEAAEWEPHIFKDPDLAADEFDGSYGALVTALGTGRRLVSVMAGIFPANTLISRSDELSTPRALMSAHPLAHQLVREESLDIVIPKGRAEDIPGAVSLWLRKIALLEPLKEK